MAGRRCLDYVVVAVVDKTNMLKVMIMLTEIELRHSGGQEW